MKTIAFTGHRPNKLEGYYRSANIRLIRVIRYKIEEFYDKGYTNFISGMALGVDQWAAEEVIDFRDTHPDVKLILAIPCINQESMWRASSQRDYRSIVERADEVVFVSNRPYEPKCMQVRNEYMVDRADLIVAVWDGTFGGTGNCVRYAKSKNKEICYIDPNNLPNILPTVTHINEESVKDLLSLADQFPALRTINCYPLLDWLQSKTKEELIDIKETKNRQAHFNAQEAMRTGDSLRSKTADVLFKECHVIQRYINLLDETS